MTYRSAMGKYLALAIIVSYYMFFAINFIALEDFEPYMFNLRNASSIYKDFIKRYNRTFKGYHDYYQRYINFVNTLRTINNINKQSSVMQKVLPNKFADWSDDERRNLLLRTTKKNRIDPELKTYLNIDDRPDGPDRYVICSFIFSDLITFVQLIFIVSQC